MNSHTHSVATAVPLSERASSWNVNTILKG